MDYRAELERIAVALERQVAQTDEQMERNLQMRHENISRHEREREEELAAVRAMNETLIAQIAEVLDANRKAFDFWQSLRGTTENSEAARAGTADVISGGSRP